MIKLNLNSGKNIDDMYHFTRTAGNFCLICSDHTLRAGEKEERGPAHEEEMEPFISVTRDKHLITTSGRKYRFGFILDGRKLSDNYKLEPISYPRYQMDVSNTSAIQLTSITRYKNGICKAYVKQYGSITISQETFEELVKYIEKQPEAELKKARLKINQDGKRKVSGIGAPIDLQYKFLTEYGIRISSKNFPEMAPTTSDLSHNTRVNEFEERIWGEKVDIKGCLKGVIISTKLDDNDTYFMQKGLEFLYKAGFAIKPSQHDIGFRPDKAKGKFIIERVNTPW